ncbi:hypothetical protein EYC84_000429 [Monilinia fructicola]|uniref:Uncharacterized protein n=1 Tax=Monilinia fructicola TaxID=38448 RepID=A0A5M9JNJ7_MONFR|nr:hypothetical protein EYC84_000429 [Monilinia fructicola]
MPRNRAIKRSSRATSQEELVHESDISSAEDQLPIDSSGNESTTTKKQDVEVEMAKITITDEDGVSDVDNHSHGGKIDSSNATTAQKKPAFKDTKPKRKPATDIVSDDSEAEGKSPKKVAATSKHNKPTAKKPATKVKETEATDNESSSVFDTKNELSIRDAISAKGNKKRGSTSRDDEIVRKKAKFSANAYKPDSYDTLNKDDRLLFDLKTQHPDWQWKEIQVHFNSATETSSETTINTLKKRWPRVKAAGTEIEHGDIQRMCVYKQGVEAKIEKKRQDLKLQFERDKSVMLKKIRGEMWKEIADSVVQNGGKNYEPTVLQDKHELYQRLGRIDGKDNYLAWKEENDNQRRAIEHSVGEDADDKDNADGKDKEASDEDDEAIDMDNEEG